MYLYVNVVCIHVYIHFICSFSAVRCVLGISPTLLNKDAARIALFFQTTIGLTKLWASVPQKRMHLIIFKISRMKLFRQVELVRFFYHYYWFNVCPVNIHHVNFFHLNEKILIIFKMYVVRFGWERNTTNTSLLDDLFGETWGWVVLTKWWKWF